MCHSRKLERRREKKITYKRIGIELKPGCHSDLFERKEIIKERLSPKGSYIHNLLCEECIFCEIMIP